jgi:ABC-type amino acid transport substrate-binding protein
LRANLARAAEGLSANNLNVGVLQNAPPFSYVSDHGYRTGFDFAVARAVCARLALRCTFVALVAEDVIPALTERRIDFAVTSMPITADNDRTVDFTRPYYATAARFVGAATPARDADAEAASGGVEVIGAMAGTPHAAYLEKVRSADTIRLYFNGDELFVDLALGRLDKALLSAIEAKQRLLSNPIGADFGYVGAPVTDHDIFGKGQGIAVREGDEPLRKALDLALADLIRTGDMKEIRDRFLDADLHISLNNSG